MRTLLLACLVIALAAASAPTLITKYVPQEGRGGDGFAGGNSAAEAAETPAVSGPRRVEIEADRDGHFYVDAEINFRPVRLIVDTGATVIALRQSDAEAAGIRPVKADFRHPVATANGEAYAAEAELDVVAVQQIEVNGVRALVLPDEQLSISLLGSTFLSRLARYEVTGGTLIFEN
jgi:aspartyl protease family protein